MLLLQVTTTAFRDRFHVVAQLLEMCSITTTTGVVVVVVVVVVPVPGGLV